ncbi:hypothetical protein QUA13_24725 [Microcoleus sp. S28C3]|uniref:hypothetical protein n=1 Tax=Microcoleus sp. S28C3 TaxID=3055414 RepID=UPI002FD5BF8F
MASFCRCNKEEGRGKKEEGRRKKEEGRRKKEERLVLRLCLGTQIQRLSLDLESAVETDPTQTKSAFAD